MWRLISFCSLLTLITCSLIINVIQLILYFTVKQFSSDLYYRINYYLCYTIFSLIIFLADWYCGVDYNAYISKKDLKCMGNEHMYVIANHPGGLDWLLTFIFAEQVNMLGNTKLYMKNSLKFIPGFGFNFNLSDFIFLSRNYEKDKEVIASKFNTLMNYPSHFMITLPPEGTRFTKEKHELSVQFAKERGLPVLKYHLTPRTKGFIITLPVIREKLKAVYDVTIAFKSEQESFDILLGKKIEVSTYVKRIPIEEIPTDEKKAAAFLHDLFVQKDKILDCFYKTGDFKEALKGVEDIVRQKRKKSYVILVNAVAWYIISIGIMVFGSLYLLLSGYTYSFTCFVGFYTIFLALICVGSRKLMRSKSTYGLNNNKNNINNNNNKKETDKEKNIIYSIDEKLYPHLQNTK